MNFEEVKNLANLPSREELVAKVLGGLNGPIVGFANVLQGNIRGLAIALNAIREQKEAQA
jgi:large subunit ribosomal protein L10